MCHCQKLDCRIYQRWRSSPQSYGLKYPSWGIPLLMVNVRKPYIYIRDALTMAHIMLWHVTITVLPYPLPWASLGEKPAPCNLQCRNLEVAGAGIVSRIVTDISEVSEISGCHEKSWEVIGSLSRERTQQRVNSHRSINEITGLPAAFAVLHDGSLCWLFLDDV